MGGNSHFAVICLIPRSQHSSPSIGRITCLLQLIEEIRGANIKSKEIDFLFAANSCTPI
uniref:Uncharacterized protein n=1 Tax=Arundo donax TaxID=35708 RepID=A0A0A9BVM7_ARUDO